MKKKWILRPFKSKWIPNPCNVSLSDPSNPVKFPSSRSNCYLWASINSLFVPSNGNRNLAIHGSYRYIVSAGIAAVFVAAGNVRTSWDQGIISSLRNEVHYSTGMYAGYPRNLLFKSCSSMLFIVYEFYNYKIIRFFDY